MAASHGVPNHHVSTFQSAQQIPRIRTPKQLNNLAVVQDLFEGTEFVDQMPFVRVQNQNLVVVSGMNIPGSDCNGDLFS